ncbi:Acetyltransferase [Azospirillum largimobile]
MVQVGHDVWIGHSTYIRAGVTIGNGAIIGACSVVTRDVPDYAVVVGNPGRIKRYRFDEKAIERLQRIAWWQYNIKDLYGCPFHDIDRALDWLEERQAAGALSPYVPEKYGAERLKAILAQD